MVVDAHGSGVPVGFFLLGAKAEAATHISKFLTVIRNTALAVQSNWRPSCVIVDDSPAAHRGIRYDNSTKMFHNQTVLTHTHPAVWLCMALCTCAASPCKSAFNNAICVMPEWYGLAFLYSCAAGMWVRTGPSKSTTRYAQTLTLVLSLPHSLSLLNPVFV